ncbi:Cof-type HAD-IIB family hydrolase [Nocardioides astragali]|uniref:Cof-type HAD-IIB family hydrolase n=1 Tax=Nocardioides astragali TaxID=1776736 RepID=A0ABW2N4A7_9ACTN|nr:Cof-type HAD-IIB family hydrolase [Nocardioides astragali]
MGLRLVATDLDGTLLRDDHTLSLRTRAALEMARGEGVLVVPVTARQPIGVRHLAEAAGFTEWAVCSNGSLGVHLTTGERLFEEEVAVAAQRRLVAALAERVPGLFHVSVRDGGDSFVAQTGYAALATFDDHKRDVSTMGGHDLDVVLAEPSLKLIVRHPHLTVTDLLAAVRGLGHDDVAATHSGAPFVEVMAASVSKAWGVARLCERLGIDREDVVAFGDAPNDVELLAWAGHGVAVANAAPAALAAADEVTASNEEDGVALVLERLLGA